MPYQVTAFARDARRVARLLKQGYRDDPQCVDLAWIIGFYVGGYRSDAQVTIQISSRHQFIVWRKLLKEGTTT